MEEIEIVDKMMSGEYSEEVLLEEAEITTEQLDEILEAHGKEKCFQCGGWWDECDMDEDGLCPDCSTKP
jgi:hypothetical protein